MRTPRATTILCLALAAGTGCARGPTAARAKAAPSPDPAAAEAAEPPAPKPPSVDPLRISVPHRGGNTNPAETSSRRPAQEDEAFFAAKLSAAREALTAGREEQALEILGATMRCE